MSHYEVDVNKDQWFERLAEQLPGWHVWFTSGGGTPRGWYAVPAPAGATHQDACGLPNRLGPFDRPQDLRAAARKRYGWDDYCGACGVLARECGHRQPESRGRGDRETSGDR
jgi:hypothetical protein